MAATWPDLPKVFDNAVVFFVNTGSGRAADVKEGKDGSPVPCSQLITTDSKANATQQWKLHLTTETDNNQRIWLIEHTSSGKYLEIKDVSSSGDRPVQLWGKRSGSELKRQQWVVHVPNNTINDVPENQVFVLRNVSGGGIGKSALTNWKNEDGHPCTCSDWPQGGDPRQIWRVWRWA